MTITLTWAMFKWLGLILFILSVLGLFTGSLPGSGGSPFGNFLRWTCWPLLLVWCGVFLARGLML